MTTEIDRLSRERHNGTVAPEEIAVARALATEPGEYDELIFTAVDVIEQLEQDGYMVVKREVLEDALEGLQDMLPYIHDYFREKWGHDGYVERLAGVLKEEN